MRTPPWMSCHFCSASQKQALHVAGHGLRLSFVANRHLWLRSFENRCVSDCTVDIFKYSFDRPYQNPLRCLTSVLTACVKSRGLTPLFVQLSRQNRIVHKLQLLPAKVTRRKLQRSLDEETVRNSNVSLRQNFPCCQFLNLPFWATSYSLSSTRTIMYRKGLDYKTGSESMPHVDVGTCRETTCFPCDNRRTQSKTRRLAELLHILPHPKNSRPQDCSVPGQTKPGK